MTERNAIGKWNGSCVARRPLEHMRARLMIALAFAALGLFFVNSVAAPVVGSSTSVLAPPLAQTVYESAIVEYNETTSINGSEVLLAVLPEGGLRGYTYAWSFNDSEEQNITGYSATYQWQHVGTWTVTLYVTRLDETSMDTMIVRVIPKADAGTGRVVWENDLANLKITLSANQSGSNYGITDYLWTFTYGGQDYQFTNSWMTFNYTRPGTYTIHLQVRDGAGNVAYDNTTVHIKRLPTFYEDHWMLVFIGIPLVLIAVGIVVMKYRRDSSLLTDTDKEKIRLQIKNSKQTWKIFRANRLGFAGLVILIIFVLMAIFAPFISTVPNPNETDSLEPSRPADGWVNPLPPSLSPSPFTGMTHPFGTDQKGQDVYSSTMYGARASLEVGIAATLISVIVGAAVGLGAGYFGKVTDEVLMRMTDFFLVIPWFPLMIVMMAILGQKFIWVVVVIGITSWPSTARIVRSQVLTVKERQFIVRAKCVGAPDSHILRKHIMPNVLPLIFANTVLLVAIAIFNEAFLDFFGLGDPEVISWGTMLEGAYERDAFVVGAWWWIIAPGAAIVIIVLAFSLVGYAIDDVLNPKLRRR